MSIGVLLCFILEFLQYVFDRPLGPTARQQLADDCVKLRKAIPRGSVCPAGYVDEQVIREWRPFTKGPIWRIVGRGVEGGTRSKNHHQHAEVAALFVFVSCWLRAGLLEHLTSTARLAGVLVLR